MVFRHPAVACVIPGCKTVEQVASNAAGTIWRMMVTRSRGAARDDHTATSSHTGIITSESGAGQPHPISRCTGIHVASSKKAGRFAL